MTSNRFFIKKDNIQFPYATIKGREHHHLSKVARTKPGENVWLFDETGKNYFTRVEKIGRSQTNLYILEEKKTDEPQYKVSLAQSLVKAKAMEMVLQKSTELGIERLIPIQSKRSVVKISDKAENRLERWKRISLEAAKQCGRSQLLDIIHPLSLGDFLKEEYQAEKLFLNEYGGDSLRDIFISRISGNDNASSPSNSVIILVGPEGGWTDEEVNDITCHGFRAINLGRTMFKSETAAIAAVAVVTQFWKI